MGFTEEELDEKRQRIADLREEIALAEEEKAREIQRASVELEGGILDLEEQRLEAQLAAINEEPPPVEEPDLDAGSPPVVDPKAAPSTAQTPTSVASYPEATKVPTTSADTSSAKTDKE